MTEAITNTDSFFKEHDIIASKLHSLNTQLGLRFQNRLDYSKLSAHVAKKLNITFTEAYKLGIDNLIKAY